MKFAGTLTLPKGDGPFPAVVMITGSGPQNRDEEILGHKPFLVIADYLTRRGIAVVRVDDRGVGGSTGDNNSSTSADFAEDALAGVEFLKGRKEIDAKRIGLIGHSEGGLVAPLAASQSRDVAFIVLLAGTGLPGDEILVEQNKLILKAAGASKEVIARQLKWLAIALPIVKQEPDSQVAQDRIAAELAKWKETVGTDEKKDVAEFVKALDKAAIAPLMTKWFRFFLSYDPRPALRKVQCPVLALNGEKDLQVPCKLNLDEIAKALTAGGNKDFTIKEFPNLNHLFQTCKTGGISEYAAIEETMAPVVLETMADRSGPASKRSKPNLIKIEPQRTQRDDTPDFLCVLCASLRFKKVLCLDAPHHAKIDARRQPADAEGQPAQHVAAPVGPKVNAAKADERHHDRQGAINATRCQRGGAA